jgi:hypothetical protein
VAAEVRHLLETVVEEEDGGGAGRRQVRAAGGPRRVAARFDEPHRQIHGDEPLRDAMLLGIQQVVALLPVCVVLLRTAGVGGRLGRLLQADGRARGACLGTALVPRRWRARRALIRLALIRAVSLRIIVGGEVRRRRR